MLCFQQMQSLQQRSKYIMIVKVLLAFQGYLTCQVTGFSSVSNYNHLSLRVESAPPLFILGVQQILIRAAMAVGTQLAAVRAAAFRASRKGLKMEAFKNQYQYQKTTNQ